MLDPAEILEKALITALGVLLAGVVLGMLGFTGMDDVARRVRGDSDRTFST